MTIRKFFHGSFDIQTRSTVHVHVYCASKNYQVYSFNS